MILFIEHYTPDDPIRQGELDVTYKANVSLNVFEEIVPITLGSGIADKGAERLRFGTVFRIAAQQWRDRTCVLANADIQFDRTALLIPRLVKRGRLLALTRWQDENGPRMVGHERGDKFYAGSQDTWAWRGGDLVGIGDGIPLGYVGCDNALLGEATRAGVQVCNPALTIKTLHNHAEAGGEREPSGPIVCGTYAYPELTTAAEISGGFLYHDWPPPDANDNA